MRHIIKHPLPHDLARKAAVKAAESYTERFAAYSPRVEWTGENHANVSFRAKGVTLTGDIGLRPGEFIVEMQVPFLFRIFEKKAMGVIEEEFRRWLDKADRGELDE